MRTFISLQSKSTFTQLKIPSRSYFTQFFIIHEFILPNIFQIPRVEHASLGCGDYPLANTSVTTNNLQSNFNSGESRSTFLLFVVTSKFAKEVTGDFKASQVKVLQHLIHTILLYHKIFGRFDYWTNQQFSKYNLYQL